MNNQVGIARGLLWGAFGVNYEEEMEHFVSGLNINSKFTSQKLYEAFSS